MPKPRKGIILAGGSGTRLYPVTHSISKQLLPVYDKPMIYYPMSVLMLAGIKEVAIITTPHDLSLYQALLGDGGQWGMSFDYIVQTKPEGLAQAYLLAEAYLDGAPSALVLGDNVFFGQAMTEKLTIADAKLSGGTVFGYQVADPERYGVVEFDGDDSVVSIVEKPEHPKSSYAVTGIYFLDERAPELARQVKPSPRGELEIVDLLNIYLEAGDLTVTKMGRGYAWLDTGTHDSLLEASEFIRTIQKRQNLMIGCPEEIAYWAGWISEAELRALAEPYQKTHYGRYLLALADG